jgi:CheY-like chemotaxis protein
MSETEMDEAGGSKTVLVVDDVSDNLILISLTLQDMGYRVLTAGNGEDGVKIAQLGRPDLILMDIAMPQLDGLAATRRIREDEDLRDVPIVALTAFDTGGFRQAAFDAGFNGYLTKPIDFARLKNLINMLIGKVPPGGDAGDSGGVVSGGVTTQLAEPEE